MKNPVKLITSGYEIPVENRVPFITGHKWRFVQRDGWWNKYCDEVPVIIGHYWRYFHQAYRYIPDEKGPDLFQDIPPHAWFGKMQNVYCFDFSVGARAAQPPDRPDLKYRFSLAALRVPEWDLIFDHDSPRLRLGPPVTAR